MGILDEAIRQHLELRRRQGAGEDELARLEGEAFGPPTRPGEPDFPSAEDEGPGEPPSEEMTAAPESAVPDADVEAESAPPAMAPESERSEATADAAPVVEAEAAEPSSAEGESTAPSFYDQSDTELELDLDLDMDDDTAGEDGAAYGVPPETGEQARVEPAPGEDPAPPIESLDTVEHPAPIETQDTAEHRFEEALEETGPAEGSEHALSEPGTGEEEVLEGEEVFEQKPEEDEDVLEETPEFLRDQPEDDELWFEQGEPKDFDF